MVYTLVKCNLQEVGSYQHQFTTEQYFFFQRHEEKDKFQVLPARMEPVAEQNTISQALLPCFGKI